MDVGALRSLVFELNGVAHGVPAVVTRPWPDNVSIDTTIIWIGSVEAQPTGSEIQRSERYRVIAVPAAAVPTVPRGTVIRAAEPGDVTKRWRVVSTEYADAVHKRVVVVPETEAS